jgi:hypothetical protein
MKTETVQWGFALCFSFGLFIGSALQATVMRWAARYAIKHWKAKCPLCGEEDTDK